MAQGLLEVESSPILELVGSKQSCSQGLCHSFKDCALPPSCLESGAALCCPSEAWLVREREMRKKHPMGRKIEG